MRNKEQIYTLNQGGGIHLRAVIANIIVQFAFMFVAVYATLAGNEGFIEDMVVAYVVMIFLQIGLFFAVFTQSIKRTVAVKTKLSISPKMIAIAFALFAVSFICFVSLNVYFSTALYYLGYNSGDAFAINSPIEGVLCFFVTCMMAPVFEELVFRYGMLEGLKRLGTAAAVFISAVGFSLIHMNPEQTFYQFALGAVMALAVLKSDSLVPAIAIHFFNNAFSFFMTIFPVIAAPLELFFDSIAAFFISPVLLAVGVFAVIKLCALLKPKQTEIQAEPLAAAPPSDEERAQADQAQPADDQASRMAEYVQKRNFWLKFGGAIAICLAMWTIALVLGFMPPAA